MNERIKTALQEAGDTTALKAIERAAGGSINESYFVETAKRRYFVKYHADAPARFFEIEAKGLAHIRATNTIAVPETFTFSDQPGNGFIVMEWLEGQKTDNTEKELGEKLAAMHQSIGDRHGFEEDTFIGILPQPNGWFSNWLDYYRNRRLTAQLNQGIANNRITGRWRKQLEDIIDRLEQWIPADVPPSCLHGDLWGGNWITGPQGKPYLIDPSPLYGDRHFELAFTELFGGYSARFYEAYYSSLAPDENYKNRKPLYQLYYLLVHLNIFGESYGSGVDAILKRYARK